MTSNSDERQRKTSRITSLSKQANDLCTLCDIPIALIIFSPGEISPTIWPNEDAAKVIVTRYLSHTKTEKFKKSVKLETYLSSKLEEKENNIRKPEKRNKEKKIEIACNRLYEGKVNIFDLDATKINELLKLSALAQDKLEERKKQLKQQSHTSQPPSLLSHFE
ncbi:MADS-box transcription factor PHERES 2-like [Lycium barbarum]|uniref:MADS-box transcription factor PHERES 2-like n=1 Tax=Lycium barbarum TaxID=112863 RepID=UPI00293EEEB7|nr:MADS-box transcription factor PHERES 2-like [Lycium barbarum]